MKKRIWKWCLLVMAVLLAAVLVFGYYLDHSDIPKLYFEGNISGMEEKSDVRQISVTYKNGSESFSGYAELKIQGTSSLAYDKKNYTIKLYEDEALEETLNVDVGWGEQNKYCLKANWIDRTHARNVVTAKLVTQVQQKYNVLTQAPRNGAVDGFPVEVYSNGAFLGLYTFNIPKDAWQFSMDEDNPDHIVIGGENMVPMCFFREAPEFGYWEVEVGEESDETLKKIQRLVDFIMNSSDEDFVKNFGQYIDLDAALNYYIMADFAYMSDNLGKNMLLATYDGEKWYPSLYDLDTTWGSGYSGRWLYDYENTPMDLSANLLFERMENLLGKELGQRYFELRQDLLTKEHILAEFEAFRAEIPGVVWLKEGYRWGEGTLKRIEDLPGYDYDQIEGYLDTVSDRLDAKYTALLGN